MPTYEYKCPKCATRFERVQRMTEPPGAACPKCGVKAARQMSGGHGLVFKGSGFYLTDYGRAGEKKKRKDEAAGGEQTDAPKPDKPSSSTSPKD